MKKNNGFLTGFMVAQLFKKNGEPEKKAGCGETLFGLIILGVAIYIGVNFGISGLIFTAILCFIIIPLAFFLIKRQRNKNRVTTQEAYDLYSNGKYTLALETVLPVTEKNPDAAYLAGHLYFYGLGCDLNYSKAYNYFKLGAAKNVDAKAMYAHMLIEGIGCDQDIDLGKSLLLQASARNNTFAMLKVGEYQLNGDYTFEKNVQSAMQKLRKAVDEGEPYAKFLVGVVLYEGKDGVSQNQDQGLFLLKAAAEADLQQAIDYLNKIYQS